MWCHARLHTHPGNLPSCPRPRRPAFSSLASYNEDEDEKEDDAEAERLTPHSPECFHSGDPEGRLADQSTVGTELSGNLFKGGGQG